MQTPRPLEPGDAVAIVSPASAVNPQYIDAAASVIEACGWQPIVMPHAKGISGTFSGTADERFADLSAAFLDPHVRAILCSRGGYGCVHLLDRLNRYYLESDPKWLIGFSDVSALHALMGRHGIISLHASMARGLADGRQHSEAAHRLSDILRSGHAPEYRLPAHPLNHRGQSHGRLCGGNLAVLQALIDTPYDDLLPDSILLIEDIAEPIYKVERILCQLRLSGRLERLSGLLVGQFTEYRPDGNHADMYAMIAAATDGCEFPIAYNMPFGHIDGNMPLLHGAATLVDVTDQGVTIIQRT